MKNLFQFNKVIYKGNINCDFYIYCLKKDLLLIRFAFYNVFYYILSLIFNSKKNLYEKNKFKYLKKVKNLDNKIKEFNKNIKYNNYIEDKKDIVVESVPRIFIDDNISNNIIAYELDENYVVKLDNYNNKIKKINKVNKLYIRKFSNLKNIKCKKLFFVNNNKVIYKEKMHNISSNIINLFVILILSIILTVISFCYTNYFLNLDFIKSYFNPLLFVLNFFIVFLSMLFLSILVKRIHIAYIINSAFILILGIANQTKLMYRDDIVKFEDIKVIKEAMIMSTRYDIVIRWYSVLFIIFTICMFFILKRYISKYNFNLKKHICYIVLSFILIMISYMGVYKNEKLYNKVGDERLINIWIQTRQYQIRGLLYPFVYTIKDSIDVKPENYDENKAKEILNNYTYQNIDDDKKVNIIAIMLEAYNDFSKFNVIDFNDDVYEKFHKIMEKSISGNLVTTIFGGGTIETERQFLTGYYNHPSYRKNTNSYAWYFKEQGYIVEAMHPIYGAFYNRASANINLGFDKYYNYENTFSKVQSEFLNDYPFFDYIIEGYEKAKKNKTPYFNFSVTYQNHGPYNSYDYDGKKFYFDNDGYDIDGYNTINEYFVGIQKTNEALEKLINYFENEDEPTIVIIFGDHNPYLGEGNKIYSDLGINLDLDTEEGFENYYETPYIIYGNNASKNLFNNSFIGKGENITPIFLMNEVFNLMGQKGNEYLQYMNDLKSKIDVISEIYYKVDGKFTSKLDSDNQKLIDEYNSVNYYYSRNFKKIDS